MGPAARSLEASEAYLEGLPRRTPSKRGLPIGPTPTPTPPPRRTLDSSENFNRAERHWGVGIRDHQPWNWRQYSQGLIVTASPRHAASKATDTIGRKTPIKRMIRSTRRLTSLRSRKVSENMERA